MNGADILMALFLAVAGIVCMWVAWSAGKSAAARLYESELANARTAARHYRSERDSAQQHLDMIRRTSRGGAA